jgi:YD repeat-containing protein
LLLAQLAWVPQARAEDCWQQNSANNAIQADASPWSTCHTDPAAAAADLIIRANAANPWRYWGQGQYTRRIFWASSTYFSCMPPATLTIGATVYCGYGITDTWYNTWQGTSGTTTGDHGNYWILVKLACTGNDKKWINGACATPVDRPHEKPHCPVRFGSPIEPLTGIKQVVVDLQAPIAGGLKIAYNNKRKLPMEQEGQAVFSPWMSPSMGPMWDTSLHRRYTVNPANTSQFYVSRGLDRWASFLATGSYSFTQDADVDDRIQRLSWWQGSIGYLDKEARSFEVYDANARLTSLEWQAGGRLDLTYSTTSTPASQAPTAGLLMQVRDHTGRFVQFTYEQPAAAGSSARITTMTDSGGRITRFEYGPAGYLGRIVWPDGTSRQFLYENGSFPWALTGEIDENGVRTRTYGYDAQGRAVETQVPGGIDRWAVTWATPPSWTIVETPRDGVTYWRDHFWKPPTGVRVSTSNGQVLELDSTLLHGMSRPTSRSQPAGAGCDASTSALSYDARGNVASRDNFNGTRTCYFYDATRNLEAARIEGLPPTQACAVLAPAGTALPAGARRISTSWHPSHPLPLKRAEPGRITSFVYTTELDPLNGSRPYCAESMPRSSTNGQRHPVLCERIEQATTDADGAQGLAAAPDPNTAVRRQAWSYDAFGQVQAATDPRGNVTRNAYYTTTTADYRIGDLQSVTNALGQVTTFPKYTAYGKPLRKVDANGVVTDYTYDPRGRLTSASTAGETTTYEYWPNGLLKKLTQPDGSFVAYEYDAAQRHTAVADHLGNRIDYVLDNAGNRTAENTKDPGGGLRRALARSFDALNRVQQVVGREAAP